MLKKNVMWRKKSVNEGGGAEVLPWRTFEAYWPNTVVFTELTPRPIQSISRDVLGIFYVACMLYNFVGFYRLVTPIYKGPKPNNELQKDSSQKSYEREGVMTSQN